MLPRMIVLTILAGGMVRPALATIIQVPHDYKTIQAAIDAAQPGDTISVAPGRYQERVRLKPGIILRSAGGDAKGNYGFQRSELTVIDGGGGGATLPGVSMAEGSTLDGFTITNVGQFNEAIWKKHFDSHGEDLGDDEGAVLAEGTIPAISIRGVTCTVSHNIVHHNGDVGIGIIGEEKTATAPLIVNNHVYRNLGGGIGAAEGAEPIIRGNVCKENLRAGIGCRKCNPIITGNQCSQNVRAGIGCREGSKAFIRSNKCFLNRRAGIGIRMEGTSPVIEANECSDNEMAGIGCRDGASPIVRNNVCRRNRMAGIGCRDVAKPLLVGNECRENEMAGIGIESGTEAVMQQNKCVDNKLVAIGLGGGSSAMIGENELSRNGGPAPIIAVKDGSSVTIRANRITGGGVAAVLVQGKATITGNQFTGTGKGQGNAVWVREQSTATIADNLFDGYQSAVVAAQATVVVTGNDIRNFQKTAITVKDSLSPAHVFGNTATAQDGKARIADVQGPYGIVADNVLKILAPAP